MNRTNRSRLAAGIGVLTASIVLTACGSSSAAPATVTVTETPNVAQALSAAASSVAAGAQSAASSAVAGAQSAASSVSEEVAAEEVAAVNAGRAIDIALGVAPGAVVQLEQGRERLRPAWEVLVRSDNGSGTEVYVHRTTGEIVNQEQDEQVPVLARNGAPAFTASQAVAAAESTISGGSVIELDLGLSGTRTVWEVDVYRSGAPNMELEIAADTGEILKQEQD